MNSERVKYNSYPQNKTVIEDTGHKHISLLYKCYAIQIVIIKEFRDYMQSLTNVCNSHKMHVSIAFSFIHILLTNSKGILHIVAFIFFIPPPPPPPSRIAD